MRTVEPRIALLTDPAHPAGDADDWPLVDVLHSLGAEAEFVVWSGDHDWNQWNGVVIRSCWDYDTRETEFRRWLEVMTTGGVPLHNSPALVQRTLHKGYLLELAEAGVTVPPTQVVRRGDRVALDRLQTQTGWAEVVVKPAVSLNGRDAFVTTAETHAQERFEALTSQRDVIVQRFMPEIATAGETSLIFFGGTYSHAIVKYPAAHEFRSQADHGGTCEVIIPVPAMIAAARRALEALDAANTVYARVDGIWTDNTLVIMEIELIDPTCFLQLVPPAATRFARSILRTIANGEHV